MISSSFVEGRSYLSIGGEKRRVWAIDHYRKRILLYPRARNAVIADVVTAADVRRFG